MSEKEIPTPEQTDMPNDHSAEHANEDTTEQPAEPTAEAAASETPQDEWHGRYLRLMADFENFKRRTNKEKDDLLQYGSVPLLTAILPLMDDLNRAVQTAEQSQDLETLKKGIQLVHKNMKNMLDKQGVTAMESLHQPFDSDLHEAIASMPSPQEDLKGKVIEEIEPGYRYRDRVIRYAKVITGE